MPSLPEIDQGICPLCNDNRSYRMGAELVVCECEVMRLADLAGRSAVYHARKETLAGPVRPKLLNGMDRWLAGRAA